MYYEGCKNLVGGYLELENRVKTFGDERALAGTVRVAAIYSVGLNHMSRHVERFRAMHPDVDVRIDYLHPKAVLASVEREGADLGLISFPRRWPDLTTIPWRDEEMVLAVHPSHRFAGLAQVEAERLDGEAFVGFDPALPIRKAVDRFLRRHHAHVKVAVEFDNIDTIKRAVEVPSGVAILPSPTLQGEVQAGTLRAVRFAERRPTRPLAIIHRRAGQLGLAPSRFLAVLAAGAEAAGASEKP